jgi:hypothetical protein
VADLVDSKTFPEYCHFYPIDAERRLMLALETHPWYFQADWVTNWLYALLFLAAIAAAIIALRTLSAIKDQVTANAVSADAAKRSADALCDIERAWILVKQVGNPAGGWYNPLNPTYTPGMVFEFRVVGRTPAKVTNAHFRLHLVGAKPGIVPPEPDLPSLPNYNCSSQIRNSEIPEGGRVLAPEDTFRISLTVPYLTEDQWIRLKDGKEVMCAYGFITYKDAFGNERETRTCYVYDFAWGGVIVSPDGTEQHGPGFYIGGPPEYNKET